MAAVCSAGLDWHSSRSLMGPTSIPTSMASKTRARHSSCWVLMLCPCEEYISDLNISTGLRQKQSRHLSSSSTLTHDDHDDPGLCLPDLPVPGCSYRGLRTATCISKPTPFLLGTSGLILARKVWRRPYAESPRENARANALRECAMPLCHSR